MTTVLQTCAQNATREALPVCTSSDKAWEITKNVIEYCGQSLHDMKATVTTVVPEKFREIRETLKNAAPAIPDVTQKISVLGNDLRDAAAQTTTQIADTLSTVDKTLVIGGMLVVGVVIGAYCLYRRKASAL